MFFTQVFPGLTVDVIFYEENPTIEENLKKFFHDGYIEVTLTVTEDNLSVCTSRRSILFVRPITYSEEFIGVHGDYTHFAIPKDATLHSVSFGANPALTEAGKIDIDIVLFGFINEADIVMFIPVIFEHNKESWMDSIAGKIFNDDAAS